jgi:hypothetical protein
MPLFHRDRPGEPLPSFEELAAEARRNSTDATALLRQLAAKLEADLGAAVGVSRDVVYTAGKPSRHGPLVEPPIRMISVLLPNQALHQLCAARGGIEANIAGQPVSLADWFASLHLALAVSSNEQQTGLEAMAASVESRPQLDGLATAPQLGSVDDESDLEVFFAGQLRDISLAADDDDLQRVITAMSERLSNDLGAQVHVSRPAEGEVPFGIRIVLPGQPPFLLAYPESPTPAISIGAETVTLEEWVKGLNAAFAAAREPSLEPSFESSPEH